MICLPYDMKQIYAFFCSRYGNISYSDLMNMGYEEFSAKLSSIPESEPIYKIFQSRVIDISKIKDKEERKYWVDMKKANNIPDIYKTQIDLDSELKSKVKNGGYTNGKGLNKV